MSWIFVVCALVCAIGMFVPAFEVPIHGHVVSSRETSLRKAAGNRDLLRKLLAAYRSAGGEHTTKLVTRVTPHANGRLKSVLEDAGDAMDTMSGISDADAKTLGTILFCVVWGFVALSLGMGLLVFLEQVTGTFRRGRIIFALVIAVVVAAASVVILLGCKAAVFETNDEAGVQILTLAGAPYMMLIGALGALAAIITLLVQDIRGRRKTT